MQYTIESPAVAGDTSADLFPIATAPGKPYLRVHCVTIFVRDQERSREFYLNTLGFSLVVDTQFEEFRWLAVAPPDGHTVLALLAPKPCADRGTLIGRATAVVFITHRDVLLTGHSVLRSAGIIAGACGACGNPALLAFANRPVPMDKPDIGSAPK